MAAVETSKGQGLQPLAFFLCRFQLIKAADPFFPLRREIAEPLPHFAGPLVLPLPLRPLKISRPHGPLGVKLFDVCRGVLITAWLGFQREIDF